MSIIICIICIIGAGAPPAACMHAYKRYYSIRNIQFILQYSARSTEYSIFITHYSVLNIQYSILSTQ